MRAIKTQKFKQKVDLNSSGETKSAKSMDLLLYHDIFYEHSLFSYPVRSKLTQSHRKLWVLPGHKFARKF